LRLTVGWLNSNFTQVEHLLLDINGRLEAAEAGQQRNEQMQRQDREHDQQLITYITWALMRSLS
jgi:hypothetical protein